MRVRRRAAEHELDVGHRQFRPRLDEGVQAARHHRARPGAEQIRAHHAHRHAVEPHLAVERAGLLARVGHVGAEMVLQILSDRQIGGNIDAERTQMLRRSDARQHQNLRRVERAGSDDDLARGFGAHHRAILDVFDAGGARAGKRDARGVRVDGDGEIFPVARRLEKGVGRRRAPAVADGELAAAEAFLLLAVVIGRQRIAAGLGGFEPGFVERVLRPARIRCRAGPSRRARCRRLSRSVSQRWK